MPKIILESLTELDKRWEFGDKDFPITIGRMWDNKLVIDSRVLFEERPAKAFISRYHAKINQVEQRYVIEDSGSRNGTYLNGKEIREETPLKNGDEISISLAYQMKFKIEGSETLSKPQTEPLTISKTVPLESTQK